MIHDPMCPDYRMGDRDNATYCRDCELINKVRMSLGKRLDDIDLRKDSE